MFSYEEVLIAIMQPTKHSLFLNGLEIWQLLNKAYLLSASICL